MCVQYLKGYLKNGHSTIGFHKIFLCVCVLVLSNRTGRAYSRILTYVVFQMGTQDGK